MEQVRLTGSFNSLLARDAIPRPGHCFQSFGIDFISAREAEAKAAIMDTPERLLHHLEQPLFVGALSKEKVLGIGTRGAVDNVGRNVLVYGTSVLLFLRKTAAQLLSADLQPLTKLLQAFLVHCTGRKLGL